jgi:hypothetical protein
MRHTKAQGPRFQTPPTPPPNKPPSPPPAHKPHTESPPEHPHPAKATAYFHAGPNAFAPANLPPTASNPGSHKPSKYSSPPPAPRPPPPPHAHDSSEHAQPKEPNHGAGKPPEYWPEPHPDARHPVSKVPPSSAPSPPQPAPHWRPPVGSPEHYASGPPNRIPPHEGEPHNTRM